MNAQQQIEQAFSKQVTAPNPPAAGWKLYYLAEFPGSHMEILSISQSDLPTLHEQWDLLEFPADELPRLRKKVA